MRLGLIGGGTMGEALIAGLLRGDFASPREVHLYEIVPERRRYLEERYGIAAEPDILKAVGGSDLTVLAVKPAELDGVCGELRGKLSPEQLVLSIVAGASLGTIGERLGHRRVVRVMPNLAARVGEAVSVWTAAPEVSPAQRELAARFLAALGREIYVEDEKYLDMATALSGSGPAYVFLFIEALWDAGVYIGLPRELSRELALQTVIGAARMAAETGRHPAELKAGVVSPGGTTAEALLAMEEGKLRSTVIRGVAAAYEKARRLT